MQFSPAPQGHEIYKEMTVKRGVTKPLTLWSQGGSQDEAKLLKV